MASMERVTTAGVTFALLLTFSVATPSQCNVAEPGQVLADYSEVFAARKASGITFKDLPGFTRSVYNRDYAIVTFESRVFASPAGWKNASAAHVVSPASGASFAMYLADLLPHADVPPASGASTERFVLVISGTVTAADKHLSHNQFVYFPPGHSDRLASVDGAKLLVFERQYQAEGKPVFQHGDVDTFPVLPVAGEVFALRKLLPQTVNYDFNVHVMDFQPGEHLYVKEVHYNQHGLLLLEGQGIYRLANDWYPVQAGDAIWMAPYVVQWYAALGSTRSRYILYKDTTVDPLFS